MTQTSIETGTNVLLSLTTGLLLCDDFSDMHAAADVVSGRPLFTHNFASRSLADEIEEECKRQHPWTADPRLLNDYPNLDSVRGEAAATVIEAWLEESIYPKYGRTCVLTVRAEPRHVSLLEGLPAKFGGAS